MKDFKILVISSVSGGGKNTVIKEILKIYPENFYLAITATTRNMRNGEIPNKDYYFFSKEDFNKMIQEEKFLEFAIVHNNYYGVPVWEVEKSKELNKHLILNIDFQGFRTIKKKIEERIISIFLKPPNEEIWLERLRKRNTDSEDAIKIRIQEGKKELEASKEYDYIVINDDLKICIEEIINILKKENFINH
ncbi:MAG: guanylate kinase [Leptonema sp. (in: bacteria)]